MGGRPQLLAIGIQPLLTWGLELVSTILADTCGVPPDMLSVCGHDGYLTLIVEPGMTLETLLPLEGFHVKLFTKLALF